jgi:hypothetical protein
MTQCALKCNKIPKNFAFFFGGRSVADVSWGSARLKSIIYRKLCESHSIAQQIILPVEVLAESKGP